ncbi:hypothetical protein PF005_g8105 [Phytophthora fragariae]|nr:hypothetical protein PF003_g6465 [Phytophthora fragariae]KAE9018934.1 hypothetical protein PR002_g12957 [Phytophthora rubi]KAE9018120.1 hypothetical protein PF011_g6401 [Phytophthora fragariae]KAE9024661.1 hypothetical protein PR001_g12619 [Phytophthora rubi]KAE9112283.1 hypothetical protein PF010_g10503 [Phytophthora fragariae]
MSTTREEIYPVVMDRSNAEIAQLKTFQEKYGGDRLGQSLVSESERSH